MTDTMRNQSVSAPGDLLAIRVVETLCAEGLLASSRKGEAIEKIKSGQVRAEHWLLWAGEDIPEKGRKDG